MSDSKSWPRLRSPSKEGRRAAAAKCATRSFFPAETESDTSNSDPTTATTTPTVDGESCRNLPPSPPNCNSNSSKRHGFGGAIEGVGAARGRVATRGRGEIDLDPERASTEADRGGDRKPAAVLRVETQRAASPQGGGGGTPASPGGKRRAPRGRSPTRLRQPRDPSSPETAYRNAVQGYLEPSKSPKAGVSTTPRDGGNAIQAHRNPPSLGPTNHRSPTGHRSPTDNRSPTDHRSPAGNRSPTDYRNAAGHRSPRNRSPKSRSPTDHRNATDHRGGWCSPNTSKNACGGSGGGGGGDGGGGGGDADANDKVPPLLLSPAEWGIGLSGEWASVKGPRVTRAVGRVSLTWADIRGSTLLHLAAQYNDVALIKEVLDCEKRRKKAVEAAEKRKERVLARARKGTERSQNEIASKRAGPSSPSRQSGPSSPTSKEIARRIKRNQAASDQSGGAPFESDDDYTVNGKASSPVAACVGNSDIASRDWLPLESCGDGSGGGGGGKGRGAAVVNKLRDVLGEDDVRKVARLAGFYLTGAVNEADWYHRTDTILPIAESRQLLVELAAAHPSDTFHRRVNKAAIQDYAEDKRSNAIGGFWMDEGIKDVLDLNARNQPGETPLILGAQNGSLECVAALLEEAGTDVTATNGEGCTALVMAAMLNKTGMVKVLVAAHVSRGVGVNHRTANGYSALHWAVVRENLDATIDLVDAAASLNTGRTDRRQGLWRLPLHKCAEYGSAECFQILLRAGADPLMEDNLGMTPMHIAASKGFVEIMRCLSDGKHAAVSVNVTSKKNGKTPLFYAVERLQLDAARFILNSPEGKAEGMKLLDGSHRAKLETMLAAAEKEKQGVIASAAASFSEFMHKVFF